MSRSVADRHSLGGKLDELEGINGRGDPFTIETPPPPKNQQRYSSFDTQLFALNHPSSSPAQAKKALEAHLAETDRRIQETSKLGTTLVQQRTNLSQRLQDVGLQDGDSKIGPELRQKLVEIEKEYNEVGRQSARAFLGPKSDTSGLGEGSNTPFALDGRNPASPTKFSSHATDSPSKLNVPRKQRNQVSNSDHIEFAAEITTSLLGQVRHLQAVLAERDEALKTANAGKATLELEAEGFAHRLKSLDDSEQRYKDENWNLETQLQEINAAAREAATREHKLQQTLASVNSEKTVAQRESDDLKQDHTKVTEDYAAVRKSHESELATLRKNVNLGENEKAAIQRKVEELTSQNQELARGLAGHFRDQESEPEAVRGVRPEDFPQDFDEREHSPPPSPTKGGQRHSMLESETLKSSLHHAHRMIQNLKGNVHREKTEKQDLKRMLQEARDELEIRRAEPTEKRFKSKSQQDMKKAGRAGLGATRNSRTDIIVDNPENDPDWEEHNGENSPRREVAAKSLASPGSKQITDSSDAYQTANETEDAFETANERDTTDNDAFQTGTESVARDSSDELTETEGGAARTGTMQSKKPSPLVSTKPGNRRSLQSTASTSEEDDDQNVHTPIQGQPQRFRLKLNRNARRSHVGSEGLGGSNSSTAKNSPASFTNGGGEPAQSLFAELENLSGDEVDDTPSKANNGTPRSSQSQRRRSASDKRSSSMSRRSIGSQPSTPGLRPTTAIYDEAPPVPRIPTVDSGMMTEPWEPSKSAESHETPVSAPSSKIPASSVSAITSRIFGGSPSTSQSKGVDAQPPNGSNTASHSTPVATSPRPAWDQPLQMFSGVIPGFDQTSEPSVISQVREAPEDVREPPTSSFFDETKHGGIPLSKGSRVTAPPVLSLSSIQSLETVPTQPVKGSKPSGPSSETVEEPTHQRPQSGSGGILGSVFGWNRSKAAPAPQIAEDETSQDFAPAEEPTSKDGKTPLQEVPANVVSRGVQAQEVLKEDEKVAKVEPVYNADQASQTVLSSEQIDGMLSRKDTQPNFDTQRTPAAAAAMKPLAQIGAVSPPLPRQQSHDIDSSKGKAPEIFNRESLGRTPPKRPSSASSTRSRTAQYPPLPPDHQEAIAAAAQREPTSMGPPLVPASAYNNRSTRSRAGSRPQTPSQQGYPSPTSKGSTTPRAGARYSTTRSQVSRRSSFSSFASELDERFNIRTDGMPMPQGIQANTDPRMIQAITQTMIGEMMWKYTRKAGRGDMSNSRHRRFFWVHPYTRTLYWSDRDPATANRAELKSKSVAIEAVRVVTDDNPMPPGLHRKSLIIVTPGRSVKFTAQTSQRHETWFNALSYLLLRTGPDGTTISNNNAGDLTEADVDEFNPQTSYNRRSARARVSLASFKSNNTANRNLQSSLSTRGGPAGNSSQTRLSGGQQWEDDKSTGSIRRRISRSLSRNRGGKATEFEPQSTTNNNTQHASISSRISTYLKQPPSARNSMRSRASTRAESVIEPGVLEGGRSIVSGAGADSAEDLRKVIEQREGKGDLENVRACCDGTSAPFSLVPHATGHAED